MKSHKNLEGKKISKWLIIRQVSSDRNGHIVYECKCDCGKIKNVCAGHILHLRSKSCGCDIPKGKNHKQWGGYEDISGNFWDCIKRHATSKYRKKVEFKITIQYAWNLFLQQNKRCALSGQHLVINYGRKSGPPHTASLDRIDSSVGYIEGNVQWVHKDINMMKRIYSQEYFISQCSKIYLHNNNNESEYNI